MELNAITQKAAQRRFRQRVHLHAFETFGEEAKAVHWLNRPNHLFGGRTPAQALEAEPESVERELTRIGHGIFV